MPTAQLTWQEWELVTAGGQPAVAHDGATIDECAEDLLTLGYGSTSQRHPAAGEGDTATPQTRSLDVYPKPGSGGQTLHAAIGEVLVLVGGVLQKLTAAEYVEWRSATAGS